MDEKKKKLAQEKFRIYLIRQKFIAAFGKTKLTEFSGIRKVNSRTNFHLTMHKFLMGKYSFFSVQQLDVLRASEMKWNKRTTLSASTASTWKSFLSAFFSCCYSFSIVSSGPTLNAMSFSVKTYHSQTFKINVEEALNNIRIFIG